MLQTTGGYHAGAVLHVSEAWPLDALLTHSSAPPSPVQHLPIIHLGQLGTIVCTMARGADEVQTFERIGQDLEGRA